METFTYDHLNRLTDIWLNNVHTGHMAYDALGRMTDKMADGQQVFSSARHDYVGPDGQLRPHAVSSAQTGDGFPQAEIQSIDYTMFDKVSTMTYNGSNHYVFEYGYDHQRTRMTATNGGILMVNKDYVGSCEFVRHAASPQLSFTYLSGPMGVFAMVEKEGATEQVQYILKDHLGSYTAITDDDGELVLQQSFDAWGNRRNPSTWTGNAAALNFHDRGFTGHEHLFGMVGGIYKEIGLINMNGRMYDPIMSSFLSVDNYVQAPDFSQSFNRYAYCLNNPLRFTDPDGEWVHLLIGALIGGVINVGTNAVQNNIDNFWQGLGYFGIGALAGALSAGVGAGVSSALWGGSFSAGFWGTTAAKVAMTSFETGSIIGAASGFTGSFVTCSGNAWMAGDSFSKGLGKGFLGGLVGGASGYVLGGLSGGWDAVRHHRDFYSGDILSAQEKLDVLVGVNMPDLESLGDPDAQLYAAKHLFSDSGVPDNGKCVRGDFDRIGTTPEDHIIIHRNNKIYIRNDRVEQAWNGNREALETISHEWIHGVQYRSGEYGELLKANNNNFKVVADLLEYRAYQINYSRTGSSRYFERMLYYGFEKHSLFDSFLIRNGLSPLYHPY